jgi:hypothetical protein
MEISRVATKLIEGDIAIPKKPPLDLPKYLVWYHIAVFACIAQDNAAPDSCEYS